MNNKGQTIMPVIIPISNEPDRCPECGKEEDIKSVCRHCGYEYKEQEYSLAWWEILIGLIIFIGIPIYVLFTISAWFLDYSHSLSSVLIGQWQFITSLKW